MPSKNKTAYMGFNTTPEFKAKVNAFIDETNGVSGLIHFMTFNELVHKALGEYVEREAGKNGESKKGSEGKGKRKDRGDCKTEGP